MPFAN